MVGDTLSDVQAARAVGCRPVLVGDSRPGLPIDVTVVENLAQAVEAIILLPAGAKSLC
jgi:phosphoglycolate phosphatase-like HAD superfamily hydrolase